MSRYDAVIFDLGETLLDIGRQTDRELFEHATEHAYTYFDQCGIAVPPFKRFRRILFSSYMWAFLKCLPGRREFHAPELTRRALQRMGVVLPDDEFDKVAMGFYEGYAGGYGLFDGVPGFLNELKSRGERLAIISNTVWDGRYIDRSLSALGIIGLFDMRLYSADFGWRKPAPSIFREALSRLGVPPNRAMMVGDGLRNDIRPASRMGMDTVWINWPERAQSDRRGRCATRVVHNAQDMMAAVLEMTGEEKTI